MAKNQKKSAAQQRHQSRPAKVRRTSPRTSTPDVRDRRQADEEWGLVLRAHFQRRKRQKIVGWVLVVLAGVIFISHMLEHTGAIKLMKPALQDLFVGYPTAGLFLVIAVLLLGQSDKAPKRPVGS